MVVMTGIPTLYQGQQFRSRLEARWASFFDTLGWRWEYEPLDLAGYIPDFVLKFEKPMLVEVKPCIQHEDLEATAAAKIDASGWPGPALIVGATPDEGCFGSRIGLIRQEMTYGEEPWWDGAHLLDSHGKPNHYGLCGEGGSFACRACVSDWGGHPPVMDMAMATLLWRSATNRVQWRRAVEVA